jgi:acylphosphatase
MTSIRAVRGVVSGRVQGVAYRVSFRREALERSLVGWVRNRSDGSVEFLVQGIPDRVQEILAWAHRGPALARVTGVAIDEETADPTLTNFVIR